MRLLVLLPAALLAGCATRHPEAPRAYGEAERERVRVASRAFDGDQRVFEFMRVQGMSRAEAEARVARIDAIMRIVSALEPKLRAEHAGNYLDHIGSFTTGEPCALLLFRKDGPAILKRHGIERPDIRAIDTPYSGEQFHAMMLPWWDRFWRAGLSVSPYQRPDLGKLIFRLHGEWADFEEASRREGWQLPPWLVVKSRHWSPPPYTCR